VNACVRSFVAIVLSAFCVSPVATRAQTQTDSSAGPLITAEQIRAAFTSAGYATDAIIDWAWETPLQRAMLRTFEVHDRATQRVVMVLVFPSVEAASVIRTELATDQGSDRLDPVLVAGYGPGVWRGNVAIVEANEPDLSQVAQPRAEQDDDASTSPDLQKSQRPVDPDFQQALNNSDINL
jgi:hypothetical protein